MIDKYHNPDEGNRRYQTAMAEKLIASLGRDAAFQASADNGWEGVVRILLPPRRRSEESEFDDSAPSDEKAAN